MKVRSKMLTSRNDYKVNLETEYNPCTRPRLPMGRKDSLNCTHRLKVQISWIKSHEGNNLLMYGQGYKSFAVQLNISEDDAKEMITLYFKEFSDIKKYFNKVIRRAESTLYAETIYGRRRQVSGINSHIQDIRSECQRKVKNSPIQGTASEIAKMAMLAIWEDDYVHSIGARMLLQVHDEIVMEIPAEYVGDETFKARIQDIMANALGFELLVPLKASAKFGTTWKETK